MNVSRFANFPMKGISSLEPYFSATVAPISDKSGNWRPYDFSKFRCCGSCRIHRYRSSAGGPDRVHGEKKKVETT